jgi:hypothetical protein
MRTALIEVNQFMCVYATVEKKHALAKTKELLQGSQNAHAINLLSVF